MKKVCFYYRINRSKLEEPERFERQVRLAVKRLGKEAKEVELEMGYAADDFIIDKATIRISYFEEL